LRNSRNSFDRPTGFKKAEREIASKNVSDLSQKKEKQKEKSNAFVFKTPCA
jgi:hypothetical protein